MAHFHNYVSFQALYRYPRPKSEATISYDSKLQHYLGRTGFVHLQIKPFSRRLDLCAGYAAGKHHSKVTHRSKMEIGEEISGSFSRLRQPSTATESKKHLF